MQTMYRSVKRVTRTREEIAQYLGEDENMRSPVILEELADDLLSGLLRDKSRTKSQQQEYPILSERQLKRRQIRETSFTYLPKSTKAAFGIAIEEN